MIGSWKEKDIEPDIAAQTGVFGFHQGAMSYAFKEDGTAFIGKSGKGRIYFNGDNGTIYSGSWEINQSSPTNGNGMMIDLDDGTIIIQNSADDNKNIKIDATEKDTPFKIGSNFEVDWDGTIKATDGDFDGKITSSSGQIGGWTINSHSLSNSSGNVKLDSSALLLVLLLVVVI
jgi:hypothetical protein